MSQVTKSSFTAEDMIRYHRGELSPKEMHLLEKAALDDAFLAEALDGYAMYADKTLPIPSISLNTNSQSKKPEGATIIPFSQRLKYMIAVAAIFILVFSVYLQLTETKSSETPALSQNEQASVNASNLPIDSQRIQKSTNTVSIASNLPPTQIGKHSDASTTATPDPMMVTVPVADQKSDQPNSIPETIESEINLTKDVFAAAPTTAATSDEDVALAGIENKYSDTKKEAADNSLSQPVTLDVISTTTGSTRQKASKNNKAAVQQVNLIEPIGGWQAYAAYIKQQRVSCQDNQGNTLRGVIKVQFMILSDGSVDRLKALGTLPDECKETAKKIVQNGPRWQTNTQTMFTVDIPFD